MTVKLDIACNLPPVASHVPQFPGHKPTRANADVRLYDTGTMVQQGLTRGNAVQELNTRSRRMPSGGSRRSTPTKGAVATQTQRQDWMGSHSAVPPAGELAAEADTSVDHGAVFACVS
jgi:hypothetical protein